MSGVDQALVSEVGRALTAGESVRRSLPGGGRLHIDRPLPFLAVNRRPAGTADVGTHQLLLGEAAYLHVAVDEVPHPLLVALVTEIADRQRDAFGAFIVLELWSAHPDRPYRLSARRHHPPCVVLEELENSLLSLTPGGRREVVVEYDDGWAPPGLEPLVPANIDELEGFSYVGLEVPAVYRDDRTERVFPFELRQLRRELGRALKRSFYAFSHSRTTRTPAHYHELGRRAMTEAVIATDIELYTISQEFDLLLHVTPVNVPDAYAAFVRGGCSEPPEFLYRPRTVDPDLMKRRLYEIPIEQIEDPTLAHIFAEKRVELDRQLTLVADRNTPRFVLGSRQLYGEVDEVMLATARRLLAELPSSGFEDEPVVSASEFAAMARAEIGRYRQLDDTLSCEVTVRDDVPGVFVSRGNVVIGADSRFSPKRAEALLAHEIAVHVLTHHNGGKQPLRELWAGMAGYESLQEGLAMLCEHLVGHLDADRLRQIAGRVLAAQLVADDADFVTVFDELHRDHGFSDRTAFTMTMRVLRGGGYTKDLVYLRGLTEVLEYLAAGGPLERLFTGKIAHQHLALIEELEWRTVLRPPRLLPRQLETPGAEQRLARIRAGSSVFDLAGG